MTGRSVGRTALAGAVAATLAVAVAFGVADDSLVDATSPTVFWVGQMSSLYLAPAFAAGWAVTARGARLGGAVAIGLLATMAALAGFYLAEIVHMRADLLTATLSGRRYALGGLVTGPLFAALGARWSRHRSWWAAGALGVCFVLQPLAGRAHVGYQAFPALDRRSEMVVGAVILVASASGAGRRRWLQSD